MTHITDVTGSGSGYTSVRYSDGTTETRRGTFANRNNNPGNVEDGPFARAHGAVNTGPRFSQGRFATFPNAQTGYMAHYALLGTSSYRNRTIAQAISRYAPKHENDTRKYINTVANALGVSKDTRISSLTDQQRVDMVNAMARHEGFSGGSFALEPGAGLAQARYEQEIIAGRDRNRYQPKPRSRPEIPEAFWPSTPRPRPEPPTSFGQTGTSKIDNLARQPAVPIPRARPRPAPNVAPLPQPRPDRASRDQRTNRTVLPTQAAGGAANPFAGDEPNLTEQSRLIREAKADPRRAVFVRSLIVVAEHEPAQFGL